MAELALYGKQLDMIRDQLRLWIDQWHYHQFDDEKMIRTIKTTTEDIATQIQRLQSKVQLYLQQENTSTSSQENGLQDSQVDQDLMLEEIDWEKEEESDDIQSSFEKSAVEGVKGSDNIQDCLDASLVEDIKEIDWSKEASIGTILNNATESEDFEIGEQPSNAHLKILKDSFGHAQFRPLQWKIINSIVTHNRDNCVVMATGYGKSLCYQYPAVYLKKIVIVISPLISLMQDQVMALTVNNIPACYLGSAQRNGAEVTRNLKRGRYYLLYVAPEFAVTSGSLFKELNDTIGISLVAIDEAHCVSQWGHDFRSSYRQLDFIRNLLPHVPIMALTATATPLVRADICTALKLSDPLISSTSFDRPNLYFEVRIKSDLMKDLKPYMRKREEKKLFYEFEGSTIIYCISRKDSEMVASKLQAFGIKCGYYHAGMGLQDRQRIHHEFIRDELQCVVATIAFGMGIDKPDVRRIIHYGAPRDIESYYQEVGRAGRDGLPGVCVVFFAEADFRLHKHFIGEIADEDFRKHKLEMMNKLLTYLITKDCRRREIISHFESKNIDDFPKHADCCDNCRRSLSGAVSENDEKNNVQGPNFGREARDLLQTVLACGDGKYGLTIPIKLLCGLQVKNISAFERMAMYCKGNFHHSWANECHINTLDRYRPRKWWKTLGKLLTMEGFLQEYPLTGMYGCVIGLSDLGHAWLKNTANETIPTLHLKNHALFNLSQRTPTTNSGQTSGVYEVVPVVWQNATEVAINIAKKAMLSAQSPSENVVEDPAEVEFQRSLYTELMSLRNKVANEIGCAPYMVANNKNLLEIATIRPNSEDNLLKIEGISNTRCAKFGAVFVKKVIELCTKNNFQTNKFPDTSVSSSALNNEFAELYNRLQPVRELSETEFMTYNYFHERNMSLSEICEKRGLQESTIAGHLAKALLAGYPVDLNRAGYVKALYQLIENTISKLPDGFGGMGKKFPVGFDYSAAKNCSYVFVDRNAIKLDSNSILPWNVDFQRLKDVKELLPETITWSQLLIHAAVAQVLHNRLPAVKSPKADTVSRLDQISLNSSTVAKSIKLEKNTDTSQDSKRKLPAWMDNREESSSTYKRKASYF
ncbi:Werner syndrome ATP-dependent helicase-like protein [Trichoplax sp. H2]|nr:Werner syndrome ATP-dependent helicase-like protein [Trichoplax sp. H2]|eukprot:RDD44535.1 Werner syndrome ATP-dependent helicase-like protein [Trichoplax sp. H2]